MLKKDTNDVDLDNLLRKYYIPKWEESEKIKLEGLITFEEILFRLKKSSNNTSPGFDGFYIRIFY